MRLLIALICVFSFSLSWRLAPDAGRKSPVIYWSEGIETAAAVKQSGIEQFAVPSEKAESWRAAGFNVIPIPQADLESRERLPSPRIAGRANVASATRRPWIDSNGWRLVRNPKGKFHYDLPSGKAALAAAEAFTYGADAILKIAPGDLDEAARALKFLKDLPVENYPAIADIGIIDDGSPATGEVMNLLTRRNLLFNIVSTPSRRFPVNIKLGTKEYPESDAADPSAFAQKIRSRLGDERRSVRIYGSEIVICRLAGDGNRARLYLLNYAGNEIEGLRVRVRGSYRQAEAHLFGYDRTSLEEIEATPGALEFSIPRMRIYAVIDLTQNK